MKIVFTLENCSLLDIAIALETLAGDMRKLNRADFRAGYPALEDHGSIAVQKTRVGSWQVFK